MCNESGNNGPDKRESSALVSALRRKPTRHVPVWFMRQAGRSLPEYRAIRGTDSILEVLKNPELAAEITMQPVKRYGVDAAIVYSDIVAPLAAGGFPVQVKPGTGPVVEPPIRSEEDLARLVPLPLGEHLSALAETVQICTNELTVPVIGFCGGPFTIASYLVEGRPSRDHRQTKQLLLSDPGTWNSLMDYLVGMAYETLKVQVDSGAAALQIFDSWVGNLAPRAFRKMVAPHLKRLAELCAPLGVPIIYFGLDLVGILGDVVELGFDAIGLDWRADLASIARRYGKGKALQGNLDPVAATLETDVALAEARAVLVESAPADGYVFNLGHGVLPTTDPDTLKAIVDLVHEHGASIRAGEAG
jgi:uroporphyrinogen decarboxylase